MRRFCDAVGKLQNLFLNNNTRPCLFCEILIGFGIGFVRRIFKCITCFQERKFFHCGPQQNEAESKKMFNI